MTSKKVVKGWGVIDKTGYFYFCSRHKHLVIGWRGTHAMSLDGKVIEGVKVVPCEIHYSLPKKK